jgi:hypothetical protein
MPVPDFSPGEVLTAAAMDSIGLWLVKTQTVGTGVATQNITSCFNSSYDNYVVTVNAVTSTGGNGGTINFKLLSGTTPTTAGFYANTFYIVPGAAGGFTNAPFSNTSFGEFTSITTASLNDGLIQIQAPFAARYTRFQSNSTDNNYWRIHSGVHAANTSYDGLQISASAGTLTGGTIRVYGYRN